MDFTVGQRGSISLEGMDVGGVPCRFGTVVHGAIAAVKDDGLTVRLDSPFAGEETLEINPERFAPH